MSSTYSEEKLHDLDHEVGLLFRQLESRPSGRDDSQERIDRILRRVRIEARIREEVDEANRHSDDASSGKSG